MEMVEREQHTGQLMFINNGREMRGTADGTQDGNCNHHNYKLF
jgi:hypothetical protein